MAASKGIRFKAGTGAAALAVVQVLCVSPALAQDAEASSSDDGTIVVTAQKRGENILRVPVPVTALGADDLVRSGQTSLKDYYAQVPGLNVTDTGSYGGAVISIRGITSGLLNGNTSTVVIDDIAYGISSNPGGPTSIVPEIDPADLQRIEILKGPQGTLYGASSLGGILKYVTIDPSISAFSARVTAGATSVHNGDGTGYNLSGAINVPLGDNFAIRASASTRRDAGYIDVPAFNIDGVNWAETNGVRVAALWRPSNALSVKLHAFHQDARSGGNSYTGPTLGAYATPGDLQQYSPPDSSGFRKKLTAISGEIKANLGAAELTSLTAYVRNNTLFKTDVTPAFAAIAASAVPGATGARIFSPGTVTRFSEELRADIRLSEAIDWLIGGYYAKEKNDRINYYQALDAATGTVLGGRQAIGYLDYPSEYRELSGFTDITFHITDQFDIQVGGRMAFMQTALPDYAQGGPLFGAATSQGRSVVKNEAFTYLLTPTYRFNDDVMIYARFASGFRPGGPNLPAATADPTVPRGYDPDRTFNYEIGSKGKLFDGMLIYDVSLYHIDWKDIQLQGLIAPTTRVNYKANGSRAKSEGVDLALTFRPVPSLTLSASGSYNVAELTRDFPSNLTSLWGLAGDRLPFSARYTWHLEAEKQFAVSGAVTATISASHAYVGDRKGPFVSPALTRAELPGYHSTSVRAGLAFEQVELSLFANNLFDKRGLLMGGNGGILPNLYQYVAPRTIGLSLTARIQ